MGWTTRLVMAVRLLTVGLLGALSLVALAPAAGAEEREGIGHRTEPGQSWGNRSRAYDWLGTYVVRGEHVFCVSFALKAPDTDERYEPGDELLTKWGGKLPADVAADISYLLLRYGGTKNPDEAAALAHLLHSWTAAPRTPADLDPAKPYTEIGYDVRGHLEKLPAGAREAVQRLRAEAAANRGPWTAEVTPPEAEQTIGTAADWTFTVRNAKGDGVPGVPVTMSLSDAELAGDQPETVTTGEDGTATLRVVPTGERPAVTGTLAAPAERPYVRYPVETGTQRVVSTGGETELTAEGSVPARTPPGAVRVAKVDAKTGAGIAGVPLRLTAEDGESPATGQDGEPLVGADGKPVVVTTEGADGTVLVEDLATPQRVCLVEVSPPSGYDDGFDPRDPPSVCGDLEPGETLALELANAPNAVPRTIPAGEQTAVAKGATTWTAPVGALAGMGVLALTVSLLVGWTARRRLGRR
ncbi:hypothetical protein B0I33_10229 [Prauserella shujinwangii]|uniref:Prealbumin-like fold domain-containing protein n=1 Tax=Prauserella shujinwangii TaxID=1453103 RepID=A0A2T0LZY7_9PSEU|nr:hypothetical protein [Prauserella shujinwangii]PRX49916.1 hypothetical protein B0I33_10229 [Prauserella shujinwangii]